MATKAVIVTYILMPVMDGILPPGSKKSKKRRVIFHSCILLSLTSFM